MSEAKMQKGNLVYDETSNTRLTGKEVISSRFSLPLIEEQIDRLRNCKVFSPLDSKNGFLHVNVHKDSRKYTSFVVVVCSTPRSQYEFLKMPLGLCTAPSVFQTFIEKVFKRAQGYGLAFNWKK